MSERRHAASRDPAAVGPRRPRADAAEVAGGEEAVADEAQQAPVERDARRESVERP